MNPCIPWARKGMSLGYQSPTRVRLVPITYLNYLLSSEALEVPLKNSTYLLTHRLTKTYMQYFHLDRPRMKERWLGFLIWTGSGSLPRWALGYRHHHCM